MCYQVTVADLTWVQEQQDIDCFYSGHGIYIYIHTHKCNNILFKNNQLHWIALLKKKWKQNFTHVGHHHLEPLYHLNINFFLVVAQTLHDFKTSTILVYMIMVKVLNGCGQPGYIKKKFFFFF